MRKSDQQKQLKSATMSQVTNFQSKVPAQNIEFADNSTSAQFVRQRNAKVDKSPLTAKFANQAEVVQQQANNTGLPADLKQGMENISGVSLDSVKVHYNSQKPQQVNAHAFAQGTDIHLASGQEKHLPHELGHVVQQAQGRVKPTATVAGVAINDSATLENEADQLGNMALKSNQ